MREGGAGVGVGIGVGCLVVAEDGGDDVGGDVELSLVGVEVGEEEPRLLQELRVLDVPGKPVQTLELGLGFLRLLQDHEPSCHAQHGSHILHSLLVSY